MNLIEEYLILIGRWRGVSMAKLSVTHLSISFQVSQEAKICGFYCSSFSKKMCFLQHEKYYLYNIECNYPFPFIFGEHILFV